MDRMLGVILCFALCGCSILLDSSDHQGGGSARDAAGTDTSFDGGVETDSHVNEDARIVCDEDPPDPIETIPWRVCGSKTCNVCGLSTQWLSNASYGNISRSEFSMEVVDNTPLPDYSLFIAYLHTSPVYKVPSPIIFDALDTSPQPFNLAEYARTNAIAEMARYDSIAIAQIDSHQLGYVVTGVPKERENASVWVGFVGNGESFDALSPGKDTGAVFGRAAITVGGARPRAYWREHDMNDEFFLGSVDIATASLDEFRRYDGPLVNQTEGSVEMVGSNGALVITEAQSSEALLLWNGDGGDPATLMTPDRTSAPAMTYLGDGRYFVAWLDRLSSVRLQARELQCETPCPGGKCTRTSCCEVRKRELELDPLAPDSIAAHALPGGGVVVVANEAEGQNSTAHLMFLDDTLEPVPVAGAANTFAVVGVLPGADTLKSFQVQLAEGPTDAMFTILVGFALGSSTEADAFAVQVAAVSVCK